MVPTIGQHELVFYCDDIDDIEEHAHEFQTTAHRLVTRKRWQNMKVQNVLNVSVKLTYL